MGAGGHRFFVTSTLIGLYERIQQVTAVSQILGQERSMYVDHGWHYNGESVFQKSDTKHRKRIFDRYARHLARH